MSDSLQESTTPDEEFIFVESRAPTEKELFYLDWGKEMVKNQLNLAIEILKQTISLCVVLLAVIVFFDKLFEEDAQFRFFAVLFLFLTLISAFIGILPFEQETVWLNSPSEIEEYKRYALSYKKICCLVSTVFLLLGVSMIVITTYRLAF